MIETAPAVVAQQSAALPSRRCFSVDEYYRMAEAGILNDDERVELIEGEIIQMPPIGSGHSGDVNRGNARFTGPLAGRAVVSIQNPVRLSSHSELVPDLALLRPRADFYGESHPGPADVLLIIEVSDSTLSYDRGRKLAAYAAAGIPEVWIEDVKGKRIVICRAPVDGEYAHMEIIGQDGSISPLAFPDLVLKVTDLLGPA
ncbi:MAG: Uma2 family endonuclease [Dehalococcoidia bacterium]